MPHPSLMTGRPKSQINACLLSTNPNSMDYVGMGQSSSIAATKCGPTAVKCTMFGLMASCKGTPTNPSYVPLGRKPRKPPAPDESPNPAYTAVVCPYYPAPATTTGGNTVRSADRAPVKPTVPASTAIGYPYYLTPTTTMDGDTIRTDGNTPCKPPVPTGTAVGYPYNPAPATTVGGNTTRPYIMAPIAPPVPVGIPLT